jgi:IPT/TIG domain
VWVSPGPAAGGARLTIKGANLSGVTVVYFGNRKATKITAVSPTELRVTTPPGSNAQYTAIVPADRYTY